MARFVIRNYGPSRQLSYKRQQFCLSNDQCIETDDADLASALGKNNAITVTDRGEEAAAPVVFKERKDRERKVTVDDAEVVYAENHQDGDKTRQKQDKAQTAKNTISGDDELCYEDLTIKELRELAEDRLLEIPEGCVKKAHLIELLEEYDADMSGDGPEQETTEN